MEHVTKSDALKRSPFNPVAIFVVMRNFENRILVIGDLHEPFSLDDYLHFCKDQYYNYNCNKVIFIGDVIDNHYSSYHETDADGLGGKDELDFAIERISRWYEVFPRATVIIGNHVQVAVGIDGEYPLSQFRDRNDFLFLGDQGQPLVIFMPETAQQPLS